MVWVTLELQHPPYDLLLRIRNSFGFYAVCLRASHKLGAVVLRYPSRLQSPAGWSPSPPRRWRGVSPRTPTPSSKSTSTSRRSTPGCATHPLACSVHSCCASETMQPITVVLCNSYTSRHAPRRVAALVNQRIQNYSQPLLIMCCHWKRRSQPTPARPSVRRASHRELAYPTHASELARLA